MMDNKTMIKVCVEQWLPYSSVTKLPDGNLTTGGPMGKLLDAFARYLNFEYELVQPPDGKSGIKLANGSWNGMIGMVHRNEVEMALGPFSVTAQREEDIDFSMAVLRDNQAIITARPTVQEDMAGFLKPFDLVLWALVLASMVAMAGSVVGVVAGEGRIFGETPKNIVAKTCLCVLSTLMQDGSEWVPPHDAGRVLLTTWLLASMVFMSSYEGILVAMLTFPRVSIPIDSLTELVHQDDLPWRLEYGAMMARMKDSDYEVWQKAFHGMSGTIPNCWSARKDLIRGKFAAVCYEMTMMKTISWDFSTSGQCHLYIAHERVYSVMVAIAFRTNSLFLEGANDIISRLIEAGLLDYWLISEISNTTQCLKPPTADQSQGVQPLSLTSLLGTMYLLTAGWSVALLVFVMEYLAAVLKPPAPSPPPLPPPSVTITHVITLQDGATLHRSYHHS